MSYDHELISKLRTDHKNNWTKVIDEYSKITGKTVNDKGLISSHHKWRKQNKLIIIKNIYDHNLISKLVDAHGNNWKLIHSEYCEMTKVNVNLINLRTSYYRTDYYLIGKRNNDFTQEINTFVTNFDETDKICSEEVYKILTTTVLKLNDICAKF